MLFFPVSPICRKNQSNNTIGAAIGETIELQCNVEASPAADVTFQWTFNDFSLDQNIKHSNHGLRSVLPYKLLSKEDFGTVQCRAQNIIGRQKESCLFNIIAAGLHLFVVPLILLQIRFKFRKQKF
jgi:hypothetical protein